MKVKQIFLLVLCVGFSAKVSSQDVSTPLVIASSSVWPNNFVIQDRGGITIGDRNISSGMHGVIFSEKYVNLTSGFNVESGAEIYIGIRNMHCGDDGDILCSSSEENISFAAPRKSEMPIVNISSASKILRNGQILIMCDGKTYTLTGQEIK